MSKPNDISNLFGEIGADASGYRDLAADNQVNASLGRWPLLATVHGHRPETAAPAQETAPAAAPEPMAVEPVPAPPVKTVPHAVSAPAPAPVSSLFKTMGQSAAPAPAVSLFKNLTEPAAPASTAAPVAGLFRRMSQPAPSPRQEPVLSAVAPAASPSPGDAPSGGNLQGLFARLEGQPDAQSQAASSISLFQRLIRK